MRKNLYTGIFTSLSVFIWLMPQFSFAQVMAQPLSLAARMEASHFAVLGRVALQHCYEGAGGNIYTLNKIEIAAWLKGYKAQYDVYVITEGGIIGNKAQITDPAVQLEKGEQYFLMLENDNTINDDKDFRLANPFKIQAYIYADAQGAMVLQNGGYHDIMNKDGFSEEALLQKIHLVTGKKAKKPDGSLYIPRPNSKTQKASDITALSPNPAIAGTIDSADFLIIKGSGFGASVGTAGFKNADDGGATFTTPPNPSDYVSWADDRVVVKIPSRAGTGTIQVNGSMLSAGTLTVSYAHSSINSDFNNFSTITRQRYTLRNRNGAGGYSFKFNTTSGFNANGTAKDAFTRAVNTWRCNTGINWMTTDSTASIFASDDENVVLFATLPAGVLARATSRFSGSATGVCKEEKTVWYLKEVDVQFSTTPVAGTTWQFGPAPASTLQFDFETVALHELGHAHGLGHRIASDEVMNFSISNGKTIRALSPEEIEGGLAKMAYSTTATCFNPAGSGTPMLTAACPSTGTVATCNGGNALFVVSDPSAGNTYQWQVDSSNDFNDLANSAFYSGVNDDSLKLTGVPSGYDQYRYRCIITNGPLSDTSQVFELSVINTWTGNIDSAWENPSNWSCNTVPDEFTNVVINAPTLNNTEVNSNATCRSIRIGIGASLNIKTGRSLDVKNEPF